MPFGGSGQRRQPEDMDGLIFPPATRRLLVGIGLVRYDDQSTVRQPSDAFQVAVDDPPLLVAREQICAALVLEHVLETGRF